MNKNEHFSGIKEVFIPIEDIKESDKKLTFSGYAGIYEIKDNGNDIVLTGAFRRLVKMINELKAFPPFFFRHAFKIGLITSLSEDSKGLFATGFIDKETKEGKYAAYLIKSQGINGLSYKFDALGYTTNNTRYIVEMVAIHEISLTPKPLQKLALIESLKSDRDFYLHWRDLAIKQLLILGLTSKSSRHIIMEGIKSFTDIKEPEIDYKKEILDNVLKLYSTTKGNKA